MARAARAGRALGAGMGIGIMAASMAAAAEIKVFTTLNIRPALDDLRPQFEQATGHKVNFVSQGAAAIDAAMIPIPMPAPSARRALAALAIAGSCRRLTGVRIKINLGAAPCRPAMLGQKPRAGHVGGRMAAIAMVDVGERRRVAAKRRDRIISIASPVGLLGACELAAQLGFIDVCFFPAPSSILRALWTT